MDICTDDIERYLRESVAESKSEIGASKTASAIQACVGTAEQNLVDTACGVHSFETEYPGAVTTDSQFDIASLTKPLVTATLCAIAVDRFDSVEFDTELGQLFSIPSESPKSSIELRHLLNHTSGLPDWRPLYEAYDIFSLPEDLTSQRREIFNRVLQTELETEPGTEQTYSDLGYMILAHLLEKLFDERLDRLARDYIFKPLNMTETTYVPIDSDDAGLPDAVATEIYGEHGPIQGTVHDRNTRALGGIAGHAGVFSTACDLMTFARHLLAIDRGKQTGIISRKSLHLLWSHIDPRHRRFTPGWDTPTGSPSTAGRGFQSGDTVGHLGFTGTSLWIERKRGLAAILLTNRVYPSRDNDLINPFRVQFHERVLPAE
jgi:CubicO group peptidase (beta-lactamase class C family)